MLEPKYKYLLKEYSIEEIACMLGGHLYEDGEGGAVGAPANSVAGGGIKGITGEPPVSVADQKRHKYRVLRRAPPQALQSESCGCMKGKFAGEETFIVPAGTFLEARIARKKGKHWTKYIGEDTIGQEIREYYHKTRGKKPIILQCERTGAMHHVHYGKQRQISEAALTNIAKKAKLNTPTGEKHYGSKKLVK